MLQVKAEEEDAMRFRIAVAILSVWAAVAMAEPATPARGPAPVAVTLGTGSVLWLEGTSNVHDFVCRTAEVEVAMTRDSTAPLSSDPAGLYDLIRASGVRSVAVRVPIKSLRSDKEGLDKNLQKAMKAE